MRRKDEVCVCGFSDTKCWWHGLKDLKVTSSKNIDENVGFKTLLKSLPKNPDEDVIFRLEF